MEILIMYNTFYHLSRQHSIICLGANGKEDAMKKSVIAELKVIPPGTKSDSLSKYVAAVVKVVKRTKGTTY